MWKVKVAVTVFIACMAASGQNYQQNYQQPQQQQPQQQNYQQQRQVPQQPKANIFNMFNGNTQQTQQAGQGQIKEPDVWYTCNEYKIGYNKNWDVQDAKVVGENKCLFIKNMPTKRLKFVIRRYKVDTKTVTLEQFTKSIQMDIQGGSQTQINFDYSEDYNYSKNKGVTFGKTMEYSYADGNTPCTGRMTILTVNDGYYILAYVGETQAFKQFEYDAYVIMNSFKMDNKILPVRYDIRTFTN